MTGAASPSRFRLKWDAQGLVLEERLDEGAYVGRDSTGLTVPPAPLAAVHPELEAVLSRTFQRFKDGWLNGDRSIDLSLSPPWGSGWLIQVGNLPETEIEEQVVWELEQRLDSPLDDHIYAWFPLEDQVFAIVIRPELLAFWDRLAQTHGVDLGSVTLLSGLVEPSIERDADLMPLYRLWRERSADGATSFADSYTREEVEELEEDVESAALATGASDSYRPVEEVDDAEAEDALKALIGGSGRGGRKQTGHSRARRLPLIIGLLVLLALGAAGYLNREKLPSVERVWQKVVSLLPERGDAADDRAQRDQSTDRAPVDPLPPPEMPSTGGVLSSLYELADLTNVDLLSIVLHDSELLLEIVGEPDGINAWVNGTSGILGQPRAEVAEPVSLAAGTVARVAMEPMEEQAMTLEQFTELAYSLGVDSYGRHALSADRAALERLLGVLKGEQRRPHRLSIHHTAEDRYLLVMFP